MPATNAPPAFWPDGKPWPSIGADVDDFSSPGGPVKLPAQEWYERELAEQLGGSQQ